MTIWPSRATTRAMVVVTAVSLLAVACGDDSGGASTATDDTTASTTSTSFAGGGVDATLTRDDVDCTEDGLGEDAEIDFTTARYVVDGNLGEVCFGEDDPRLQSAWESLASITPPGQLADLGVFAGFATDEVDEVTVAFVEILDDDGSLFQMAVNLDEGDADPDDFTLTMAHEFSHVFTSLPFELDRFEDPEFCTTYDNGEGCYTPDSLMAGWIATFWGGGLIDEIDPLAEATSAEGDERCDLNPGFFGPYAASNPEEDFAEAFSVFVFQVPVDTPEQQAKMDWIADRPGLLEFRAMAESAGLGPLPNNFEPCG